MAMAWPPADEGEEDGEHGEWHMFEVWSQTYTRIANGSEFAPPAIAPRCGALMSLRPVRQGAAVQLVGTNVHISCGLEVARWQVEWPSSGGTKSTPALAIGLRSALVRRWRRLGIRVLACQSAVPRSAFPFRGVPSRRVVCLAPCCCACGVSLFYLPARDDAAVEAGDAASAASMAWRRGCGA